MTPSPAPPSRVFSFATVLAFISFACHTQAEQVFVGIMEADSYQSVIYSASAFSRVADLPIALEVINDALMKTLALPSFNGVASTEPIRVVQTVDPSLPLDDSNPSNVAIMPISATSATVLETFSAAYTTRSESGYIVLFTQPKNTNLVSRVAVAVSGRYLLTSTSSAALVWAWQNRAKLIDAPPQRISGTLRVFVNPQRFADILGTRSEKAASFLNLDKLLRDLESFSFSLTLDGQALTLTLWAKPMKGSALESLKKAIHSPSENLWNGLPDNAFFASLSACDNPKLWDTYLGEKRFRLLRPVAGLAPQEAFTGERLLYVAPTKSKQGFCFVQVEPVRNAETVRQAIQKLHTVKAADGFDLIRKPSRQAANLQVESYDVAIRPPAAQANGEKAEEASLTFTIASLFLKQAVLEATVSGDYLICVLGPAETLEDELANLDLRDKPLTLKRKIIALNPSQENALSLGASLNVADLLRHIVTIMPGVKPEQLRVLSSGGDGATFGIGCDANQTLTASLSIQSNEIAALQRMNRDGREVLQELFFQLFTRQMMEQQVPAKETKTQAP